MATCQEHEQAWRHNRKFLTTIQKEFTDWKLTVAFYTALHVVDWLLVTEGNGCIGHTARNGLLKANRYSKIWRHYQPLFNASLVSRYKSAPNQFDSAKAEAFINNNLLECEKSVFRLLKRDEPVERIAWMP